MAASLVALVCALALCVAIVAAATGGNPLLWPGTPSAPALVGALWIAAAVAAVVSGIVAIVLRHPKRLRAVLAAAFGVFSLLIVPVTAVAALAVWAGPHHPSDKEMISDSQQHQRQFDHVAAELDAGGRVDRGRLRGAGIHIESTGRSGDAVLISVSSWGIVPSGSEKGYAYSPETVSPLTTGDSERFGGEHPDEIVYRHISGPWYIYYTSW